MPRMIQNFWLGQNIFTITTIQWEVSMIITTIQWQVSQADNHIDQMRIKLIPRGWKSKRGGRYQSVDWSNHESKQAASNQKSVKGPITDYQRWDPGVAVTGFGSGEVSKQVESRASEVLLLVAVEVWKRVGEVCRNVLGETCCLLYTQRYK